jgi:pimeloyl-ACP methyl ester carboxylesterase
VELQQSLFGDAFNVVGLVARGATPEFVRAAVGADGRPDWAKAWRIFNSEQWVDDVEAVRKAVVGETGAIHLYGRSGGAYLVHQYLAKHGSHVRRAFTQAPVNPFLNAELGIEIDTFWRDLGTNDKTQQETVRKALEKNPGERVRILIALQRQHFFVPADQLPDARSRLIRALAEGDRSELERACKEYQVDDVIKLCRSDEAIPQHVRVVEMLRPTGAFRRLGGAEILPLIETQHTFTKSLLDLIDAGRIAEPHFDCTAAHRLETEVFILAGRWDEAVDYRTSIALAHAYPRHQLFIANDNHTFKALNRDKTGTDILRAFLGHGLASAELRQALQAAEPVRWSER